MTEPSAPAPLFVSGRLTTGIQVTYGIGQVAGQVFRDIPALLLLFFMTNALGVAPALAGVAIFVPKLLWGVVCDIGVGIASDRFNKRFSRRWWLLMGACGAPVAMVLLFHVPHLSEGGKAAYVAAVFSLYMLVFATFSVPYLSIASELAADPHGRTVVMAWRLVFTSVGVLIADSLTPIFVQHWGGGQPAYELMSYVLAILCPLALVSAFFGAGAAIGRANSPMAPPKGLGFPIREALGALWSPKFFVLLAANLIQLTGAGMGYAAMLYFFTYNLGRSDALVQVGLITIIACATIIASQPVWVLAGRRMGKKATYVAASVLYSLVLGGWGFLGPGSMWPSYAFAILLGISNSGWTLMGFSMVSDLSQDGRAGLYSSVWIAADKIGFALGGTLLLGLVLALFGFNSARAVAGLAQPGSALTGVLIAFSMVPAVTSALAAFIFGIWGQLPQQRRA
ncbi:MAG: MFS transporter [Rhizomicrobium sp.]